MIKRIVHKCFQMLDQRLQGISLVSARFKECLCKVSLEWKPCMLRKTSPDYVNVCATHVVSHSSTRRLFRYCVSTVISSVGEWPSALQRSPHLLTDWGSMCQYPGERQIVTMRTLSRSNAVSMTGFVPDRRTRGTT